MLPEAEASRPEVFERLLAQRGISFGIDLSCAARGKLSGFLAALDLARRRTNLTGPLTAGQLVDHALESIVAAPLLIDGAKVVDIGSGAGFPGVPLAIARPDIRLTVVEPRRKRLEFLKEASEASRIGNVDVYVKKLSESGGRAADAATARAVGGIERILGEGGFLKPEGLFLAWTTDAAGLALRLGRRFSLENSIPIPESRNKVIAVFRRVFHGEQFVGERR